MQTVAVPKWIAEWRVMRTIDLFCGAGGLGEGFRQAGFSAAYANDHEAPAIATYTVNHPNAVCSSDAIETVGPKKIREQLGVARGEIDVVMGGPPCQGFSTYGQRREDDSRNQLYVPYFGFVEEFRPKAFLIENVVGLLSMSGGAVLDDMVARATALGYAADVVTLNACEYGVPQNRRRVFIFGASHNQKIAPPVQTHASNLVGKGKKIKPESVILREVGMPSALTVRDAISDLPNEVCVPSDTQKPMTYPEAPHTDYQRNMRGNSHQLTHHSSKRMLGIRRLRLAMLHPGDYGTKIEDRLASGGLTDEIINSMMGGEGMRDAAECRTEDRVKEEALREMLKAGRTTPEQVMQFLESQGFANKYRRLEWDKPSHTVVAHMARDCSDFVHPGIDRFVSVREAARFQSFPDSYCFPGSQFRQFRQIGNAVPPLLGKAVAETIKATIA
ncbi:DNA cytosine methyltransferase [Pseudopelagicola sp. nBUS_20]|uniref:DNA cytosine methyltransferase n=2 Tax=unclassified Pseudopelagicola TaxID=2649563 RepID=UPI003EBD1BBA